MYKVIKQNESMKDYCYKIVGLPIVIAKNCLNDRFAFAMAAAGKLRDLSFHDKYVYSTIDCIKNNI